MVPDTQYYVPNYIVMKLYSSIICCICTTVKSKLRVVVGVSERMPSVQEQRMEIAPKFSSALSSFRPSSESSPRANQAARSSGHHCAALQYLWAMRCKRGTALHRLYQSGFCKVFRLCRKTLKTLRALFLQWSPILLQIDV